MSRSVRLCVWLREPMADGVDNLHPSIHFLLLPRQHFPAPPCGCWNVPRSDIISGISIIPLGSGPTPGSLPSWKCPEILLREPPRRHPNQMPKQPQDCWIVNFHRICYASRRSRMFESNSLGSRTALYFSEKGGNGALNIRIIWFARGCFTQHENDSASKYHLLKIRVEIWMI